VAKVAVTGASGFIGRHVVTALLERDVGIVAASRSARPLDEHGVRVEVAEIDITSPDGAFDRLGRPDVLIHLAWGGLPNYQSISHLKTELGQQQRFLSALVRAGLPRLVVAGTCLEYGMRTGALSEADHCEPSTPYGFAKLALLRHLQFLRCDVGFELTWARLFYTFGPGQAPTSLWSLFNAAVGRGDHTFDMSAGEQLRDFLPVGDLAARLVDLGLLQTGAGIVNLGSGKPTSVRTLVEGWRSALQSDISLNLGHYPYPNYEPMAFWADCTKLSSVLSSAPDETMRKGAPTQ